MDNREAARLMTANGIAWVLAAKHKRVDASFRSFTVPWAGNTECTVHGGIPAYFNRIC